MTAIDNKLFCAHMDSHKHRLRNQPDQDAWGMPHFPDHKAERYSSGRICTGITRGHADFQFAESLVRAAEVKGGLNRALWTGMLNRYARCLR